MSCFDNQQRVTRTNSDDRCGCNCENNGIVDILRSILAAQKRAEILDEEEDFCDRTVLGPCCEKEECNTRPIKLYTCAGEPVAIDFTMNGETRTTTVFRIEKIDGCICTFRCLAEDHDKDCKRRFIKTNTFFSVNEGCCCHILKCLEDTFVECI